MITTLQIQLIICIAYRCLDYYLFFYNRLYLYRIEDYDLFLNFCTIMTVFCTQDHMQCLYVLELPLGLMGNTSL